MRETGFTLVEILVALLLLAVLAGIGFSVHTAALRAARSAAAVADASRRGIMALNRLAEDLANLVLDPAATGDRPVFAAGPPSPEEREGRATAQVFVISFAARAVAGLDPQPSGTPLTVRYLVLRNANDSFRLARQVAGRPAVTLVPELADYAFSFIAANGERFPHWPPDTFQASRRPRENGVGPGPLEEEEEWAAGLPAALNVMLVLGRATERYPFRTTVLVGSGR